jgi:predicted peroxiredoxin
MAQGRPLVYMTTCGAENPTKAAIPFIFANAAVEAGLPVPTIFLFGDAVTLMKDAVAAATHPVGFPVLSHLIEKTVQHKIPIYVSGPSLAARGVTAKDLENKNTHITNPTEMAQLFNAAENVISI